MTPPTASPGPSRAGTRSRPGGGASRVGLPALLAAATSLAPVITSQALAQSAAEPLVTDRPDATESAVSVAPGRVQLEAGYTMAHAGAATLHSLGEGLLRIGVAGGTELRLGLNSYRLRGGVGENPGGLEDASVGTKVVLRARATGAAPGIALLAGTSLPTGSEEFGAGEVQPGGMLALAWDLSPAVGLGANLGYTRAHDEDDRFDEYRTSLALGIGLTDAAGVFVEYFADHRPAAGRPSEISADGGLTVLLNPDFQLDLRGGLGLNSSAPDYFVGAGLSVRR